MRKSWLLCVLLGTLAWGQAAPATPPPAAQAPGTMPSARPAPPPDTSADIPDNTPVITVTGVCPAKPAAKGTATTTKPAAKTSAADCKTVITKAQFESLAKAVAPNMNPQVKRQLSTVLPRIIGQSAEAKKKGIQNTPQYKETLKFAEMQILSQQLQRRIQDDAAKVPQADIDAYYSKNPEAFEQFNLDRLFVPRTKQAEPESKEEQEKDKDEKLTDEQKKAKEDAEKAKTEANEQQMTKLADDLRARAAAGEDFIKLQKEAFDAAGMKIESPTVNLPKVRRTGLPPAHSAVFDLKPGEVSQVISDNGGHYIYKVISKDELPLDQVKDEIHNKLQNERQHDMMDKITSSYKVDIDEKYFGPASAGPGMPPQRMPHPRMMPSPTSPQAPPNGGPAPSQPPSAAPQTPPPAQSPAAQPN
jgi:hypothetical protein